MSDCKQCPFRDCKTENTFVHEDGNTYRIVRVLASSTRIAIESSDAMFLCVPCEPDKKGKP